MGGTILLLLRRHLRRLRRGVGGKGDQLAAPRRLERLQLEVPEVLSKLQDACFAKHAALREYENALNEQTELGTTSTEIMLDFGSCEISRDLESRSGISRAWPAFRLIEIYDTDI